MQIFLSYSRANLDKAFDVREKLEQAGHQVFEEFGIDGEYRPYWTDDLAASDLVIALFSPHFKQSKRLWVHLTIIQQYEKPLIPVLVEGTENIAIPFGFENYAYLDARTDFENKLDALMVEISQLPAKPKPEIAQRERAKPALSAAEARDLAADLAVKNINKIFIAYSRKQRDLAKSLYELLSSKGQFAFWDAKLRAGANWRQTIQRALDECTHLIVIWTPDAAQSDEVEREVSYALAKHKTIIPILSKEIPELPYHLFGLHYLILQDDMSALERELMDALDQFSKEDDLFS
jgi:hypothetical protein